MSGINKLREGIIAFILIAVIVVLSSGKSYSQPDLKELREADSLALVALYHATDGANWLNNSNWLVPGMPINTWYGVSFSGTRVTMLSLISNNLTGYIPNEISNLTSCMFLKLNGNYLSGLVPSEMALLSITRIYINGNLFNFEGIANSTIPSSNSKFIYHPQLSQPAPELIRNGNEITLNVKDRFSGNQYFWYNNGTLIEGVNSYEYTFVPVSTSSVYVQIKNSLYPSLTLVTEQVLIEVIAPELVITNPESVCSPGIVDITGGEITEGSTPGLSLSYFRDANALDPMTLEEAQAIGISGTYYIKGINEAGLSDIKPIKVVINSNPVVSGQVSDVTCMGGNNGSIDISVNGGKSPYTFNWSTGVNEEDINNISEGTYQVTVIDGNSCNAISSFVINQNDSEHPVVIAKDTVLQLDESGSASLKAEEVGNSCSDNCGIASMVISRTLFSCSNIGENIDTLIVTDLNGNVSEAVFTVIVEDMIAPGVITQDVTLELDQSGNAVLTTAQINNGSNDACGIESMKLSKTEFSCENLGDNTVTLTITDAAGNTSTGDALVKVLDFIAPEIAAPASVSIIVKESEVPVVELGNPVTSDNCGVKEVSNNAPQYFEEGITNVTWTVTDESGNTATAVQVVEIIVDHNQLPQILSLISNAPVELGEATEVEAEFSDDNLKSATFDWGDGATSNGNIVGQKIYGTHIYAEAGNYIVTLSIYDEAGESATMEYVNSVVDNSSSGHITGGGWINSANGDYKQVNKCDKGNFGFEVQSDKKKGVRGNFNFNLHNANFRVRSNNIEWLTINYDHALFAGSAEVNGRSGYKFLVSAVDVNMNKRCRDNDLLRIMVWDSRDNLVYDNQQGSGNMDRPVRPIGHGEIVIHEQREMICYNFKSATISEEDESVIETALFADVKVFPNPAENVLNIDIPGREGEMISYDIFDITGKVIVNNMSLEVWGQSSWIDLEQFNLKGGMYVLKLKSIEGDEDMVVRFMKN